MKITENEPQERNFTIEMTEKELAILYHGLGMSKFNDVCDSLERSGKYDIPRCSVSHKITMIYQQMGRFLKS